MDKLVSESLDVVDSVDIFVSPLNNNAKELLID